MYSEGQKLIVTQRFSSLCQVLFLDSILFIILHHSNFTVSTASCPSQALSSFLYSSSSSVAIHQFLKYDHLFFFLRGDNGKPEAGTQTQQVTSSLSCLRQDTRAPWWQNHPRPERTGSHWQTAGRSSLSPDLKQMTFDSIKKHRSRREWLLELQKQTEETKTGDTVSCCTVVLLSEPLEVTTVLLPTFTDLWCLFWAADTQNSGNQNVLVEKRSGLAQYVPTLRMILLILTTRWPFLWLCGFLRLTMYS